MEDDVITKRLIQGIIGGTFLLLIIVLICFLKVGRKNIENFQIYLQTKAISIHGTIGDTIPYEEITEIIYHDKVPAHVYKHGAGVETKHLVCADAKLNDQNVRAYVYKDIKGYLTITTNHAQYIVNEKTQSLTKQLLQDLQKRIKSRKKVE